VLRAAAAALDVDAKDADLNKAAAMAQGSVARALALYDGPTLALREKVAALEAGRPLARRRSRR